MELKLKVKIPIRKKTFLGTAWTSFKENSVISLGVVALLFSLLIALLVFFHFQLGVDIWGLGIKNPESAQYWGQIGDFVGGILNPLLSFCALIAVLYNLVLQRKELEMARADAREAQRTQNRQSEIFEIQNFESVFFRLLETHSKLSAGVKYKAGKTGYTTMLEGGSAFESMADRYFRIPLRQNKSLDDDLVHKISGKAQAFMADNTSLIGHYFRNMYQILKYIDGFGRTSGRTDPGVVSMESRRVFRYYQRQRDYANMLRAQLSSGEVACLFLNCLTDQGSGLKYYVEKYSMLKTVSHELVEPFGPLYNLYDKLAYADSEDILLRDVVLLIQNKYRRSEDSPVYDE